MSRWRWVTGLGVVAALAVVLVMLSTRPVGDPLPITTTTTATLPVVVTTTTMTIVETTVPPTTSTTSAEERRAELEELLQRLWFGWFDAIYRKDADALWEVVATTRFHDAGVAAMETMEFVAAPRIDLVAVPTLEVLLDRSDCLVISQHVKADGFLLEVSETVVVSVLWSDDRYGFRFATDWKYEDDLWLHDCDSVEREVTP